MLGVGLDDLVLEQLGRGEELQSQGEELQSRQVIW